MAESTWEHRERPILEAIAACEEEGVQADREEIAFRTAIPIAEVGRSMRRLLADGCIDALDVGAGDDDFLDATLAPRGLRQVGVWPETAADAFLARLDALIAEADPAERSKLKALRDGAANVGGQVLAGAIVAAGAGLFSA